MEDFSAFSPGHVTERIIKHCNTLLKEAVQSPSLDISKSLGYGAWFSGKYGGAARLSVVLGDLRGLLKP